jgi:hypothetical protein
MDYVKYMKNVGRINFEKLALWAVLLSLVVIVGIAILGSGIS